MISPPDPGLFAALHPPRLPEAFARLGAGDLISMAGLGLCLAGLIVTLLAPALKTRPRSPSWRASLKAAAALPEGERLLHLARLARQRGIALLPSEQQGLYDGSLRAADLETRLRRARPGAKTGAKAGAARAFPPRPGTSAARGAEGPGPAGGA